MRLAPVHRISTQMYLPDTLIDKSVRFEFESSEYDVYVLEVRIWSPSFGLHFS